MLPVYHKASLLLPSVTESTIIALRKAQLTFGSSAFTLMFFNAYLYVDHTLLFTL